MRCIRVQRNFSFAYSKEMIHQNCCWLWRRRKEIFPSVPGALLWFLCSATWEWIKHISSWFLCCVKGTEDFACLVFFVSTVCPGKLEYSFPYSHWIWMCKLPEFPNLDHFSQSSHTGVPDSGLPPPRAVMAKRICAGLTAFCSDPVKMPLQSYCHF